MMNPSEKKMLELIMLENVDIISLEGSTREVDENGLFPVKVGFRQKGKITVVANLKVTDEVFWELFNKACNS